MSQITFIYTIIIVFGNWLSVFVFVVSGESMKTSESTKPCFFPIYNFMFVWIREVVCLDILTHGLINLNMLEPNGTVNGILITIFLELNSFKCAMKCISRLFLLFTQHYEM